MTFTVRNPLCNKSKKVAIAPAQLDRRLYGILSERRVSRPGYVY
jgi:hypothetical protein